jgi:hypothetical protein
LELDEGDPGFQLLREEEISAVIFFYLLLSALPILLNSPSSRVHPLMFAYIFFYTAQQLSKSHSHRLCKICLLVVS